MRRALTTAVVALGVTLGLGATALATSTADEAEEICVKVEGPEVNDVFENEHFTATPGGFNDDDEATTLTVVAKEGFVITSVTIKAGSGPSGGGEITYTDEFTDLPSPAGKGISHYTVCVTEEPEPEPTETVTPPPTEEPTTPPTEEPESTTKPTPSEKPAPTEAPTETAPPGGELPDTGSSPLPMGITALALVAAGGGLVLLRRRLTN